MASGCWPVGPVIQASPSQEGSPSGFLLPAGFPDSRFSPDPLFTSVLLTLDTSILFLSYLYSSISFSSRPSSSTSHLAFINIPFSFLSPSRHLSFIPSRPLSLPLHPSPRLSLPHPHLYPLQPVSLLCSITLLHPTLLHSFLFSRLPSLPSAFSELLIPLPPPLFPLSPIPPSFPPSLVNRDERSPACVLLPLCLPLRRAGRCPRLQRPTWELLGARRRGYSCQLGRGRRVFQRRCSGRLGPRGSLRLPFPGLDFKGGVLAGSGTLRNPEGEGELLSVAGGVAPPAPQSAVSLLALLAGLGPGRRCGKDMVVYGFA